MPRGMPDDSDIVKEGAVYGLSDVAELAVRLGSIVSYDRYGDVVYLDAFEGSLAGYLAHSFGAGGTVTLCNTTFLSGTLSVFLHSGTGARPQAVLERWLPPPVIGKVGLQVAFTVSVYSASLRFSIIYCDGTHSWTFSVRYDRSSGVLTYVDALGNWVAFATPGALYEYAQLFHIIKLVVNLKTLKYERTGLNQVLYGMSGFEPYRQTVVSSPYIALYIESWGNGTTPAQSYLDNLIVTQNEY